MERMHRAELVVSILLAAVVVGAIGYATWATLPPPAPAAFAPTPSFELMPQNTSVVVAPGQARTFAYSNATAANYLAGFFTVTPVGSCGTPCWLLPGVFLMNGSQFAAFEAGGFNGWISGALYATNVSIFALLQPGAYDLVLWNHGDQFGSNVSLRFTASLALDGYASSSRDPVPPTPAPRDTLLGVQAIPIGDAYSGGPLVRYDVALPPSYWTYRISGFFSVGGGATTMYLVTTQEWPDLLASFSISNTTPSFTAVVTVGPTAQAYFNATVPAGSYDLVFANDYAAPGLSMYPSITVDVPQAITATAV